MEDRRMNFDIWWKENRPEDMPVDCYHRIKEVCRAAWERAREEENCRCGLIAETYPFSPLIGGQIAAAIYRGKDD
jgi:hypothetical protein